MKKIQAYILIILSGFLFATSGIFVRVLNKYGFSSLQMTAMRGIISALVLLLYVLVLNKKCLKQKLRKYFCFF
jgi:drug/metabolite transporter (DMT)-like permease